MSCNSCWLKMPKILRTLVMLFALGALQANALAADWRDDVPQAKLMGSGDLRWFGFHIYSARLWSDAAVFDQKQRFALELTYQKNISREQFVDTSLDEIKRLNGDSISQEVLQRWKKYMETAFTDVKNGDQLIGVYLPKIGCRFYSRNKLLGEFKDMDFANAFFAIWFDPRSKDSGLRKRLTGEPP
jgi:hypothetical protein